MPLWQRRVAQWDGKLLLPCEYTSKNRLFFLNLPRVGKPTLSLAHKRSRSVYASGSMIPQLRKPDFRNRHPATASPPTGLKTAFCKRGVVLTVCLMGIRSVSETPANTNKKVKTADSEGEKFAVSSLVRIPKAPVAGKSD